MGHPDPNDQAAVDAYNESKRGPQGVPAPGFARDFFSGWRWWGDSPSDSEPDRKTGLPKVDLRSGDSWDRGPDRGRQRMDDLMEAAREPRRDWGAPYGSPSGMAGSQGDGLIGRNMQGPWNSGRFTPGGGSTRGVGPDWQDVPPTVDELYEQLFELRRQGAQGTHDSISEWATDRQRSGSANIGRMRGRLDAQWDVDDERRAKDVKRIDMAEAGNYKGRKEQITADADAGSARLVELGIDPATFIDSAQDEYGARLANSFAGAATFSANIAAMGNQAASDRRSRAEQGFSQAEGDLTSGIADVLFMAGMNLDNSLAAINEAVLMREIGKVEAADLVDQQARDNQAIAEFTMTSPEAVGAFIEAGALSEMLSYIKSLNSIEDEPMVQFGQQLMPVDEGRSRADLQKALYEMQTDYGDEGLDRFMAQFDQPRS